MTRTSPRLLDWSTASSLADLGVLTTRYLSGEAGESPTYGGPPNAETAEILEPLLALNRAGLVTDTSQPGKYQAPWLQRAFVDGFCGEDMARHLASACDAAGLEWFTITPEVRPRWKTNFAVRIPATCREGAEHTWLGAVESTRDLRSQWGGYLCREGLDALLGACHFTAYDPQWGRKDLLWDTLLEALR